MTVNAIVQKTTGAAYYWLIAHYIKEFYD